MFIDEDDYLAHYGILRKSGRYPWGSGEDQSTRNKTFLDYVDDMRRQGLSDVEICRGLDINIQPGDTKTSTTALRAAKSIAKNEQKQADISMAQRLHDKGMSNVAIGERMGKNESSVRALLTPGSKDKADVLQKTATMLKDQVAQKKYIDIGTGVENHLGISSTRLQVAVAMTREEGYTVHYLRVPQLGTGLNTTHIVLAAPGTTYSEVFKNRSEIQQIGSFSEDGGRSFIRILPPIQVHPDRVGIRYGPDGGSDADGVIFVRPGVSDLSLGSAHYAQVRIAVGDGHYLKGMAMHKEDLPDGVDLVFNTNKSNTGNKFDAMKPVLKDADNPFGAIVHQISVKNPDGTDRVTSAMNIVNEEGDWIKWSKTLSTQFLSKQSRKLAETQLNMTYESRKNELDEILKMTNPTVRKKLLSEFSDSVDSASVHLKAAHLPRQATHVILPIESMSSTEVYAPNYRQGERVVLIRHPHGGTFEIPELVVNNNQREAKSLLGTLPKDAIGIHPSVAARLSGADFDGDSVLVIPNDSGRVRITPALEGLKGFDTRAAYPGYEGMKKMTNTQTEMGKISNLVTDMTIRGAGTPDLARAIRHSMVVIDAEKHGLDYKRSALDNGIKQLQEKYQSQSDGGRGASTLISRARSRVYVPERIARKPSSGGPIDPITGKKVFEETGALNFRTGTPKLVRSKQLAETDDAHTLSSGTPIERLYADHSNRLKDMANKARLELIKTPRSIYSPSANKAYAPQVKSLEAKLNLVKLNRPLERQAQIIAGAVIRAKRADNPTMDASTEKKMKFLALEEARIRTGAKKNEIKITQDEWDAIQAGAISSNHLAQILDKADMKIVRQLATPKQVLLMTSTKIERAKTMLSSGYTRAEVADHLGVSLTTLDQATNNEE